MSVNTLAVSKNAKEYKCRRPQYSSYYECIEDNYENTAIKPKDLLFTGS